MRRKRWIWAVSYTHLVKAYKGLKDFEKVAALRESIISIIDGINSKDKQNAALELNAIHKADEQEEYIAEQTLQDVYKRQILL